MSPFALNNYFFGEISLLLLAIVINPPTCPNPFSVPPPAPLNPLSLLLSTKRVFFFSLSNPHPLT